MDGKINTSGRVVIGKEGTVSGEVHRGYADVIGNFNGSRFVDGLLTIQADGIVEGQVNVGKLAVESGATLNAQCSMKAASVESMVDEKSPKAEKTA